MTIASGQVTISPIHGGGAATFVGNAETLQSQSSNLVFFGQANHSMLVTRMGNLGFRSNVTSSGGGTCSMTFTRPAP